jgi:tetratricopeptide (TPR) repeat protein
LLKKYKKFCRNKKNVYFCAQKNFNKNKKMNRIKLLSIAVALFGLTNICSAQTIEEVNESLKKGQELMASGDIDGTIKELENCIDLAQKVGDEALEFQLSAESALPRLYFSKAEQLYKNKDYSAALDAFSETVSAAQKYNDSKVKENAEKFMPVIYYTMGVAEYQDKKYDEAIVLIDKAIEYDINFAKAYYIKGAVYQTQKNEANMSESYKLAIEKGEASGDNATAKNAKTQWFNFYNIPATQAFNAQKWDEAISLFTKAIEIDNLNSNVYLALGTCYNYKKSWDTAISSCEKSLELKGNGDTNDIYYQLGVAYEGKKDTGKACECFKKVTDGRYKESAKFKIEQTLKCK